MLKTTNRFFAPAVVLAAVLAGSVLAQVSSEPNRSAATTRLSRRQHGPVKIHGWRPDNQVDSENWSGYAVTGSAFTQVLGSWTVPAVNCSVTPGTRSSNDYASFWVGIDGYTSSTVEQIGTDSDCDYATRGSVPSYYAWYEFYPANSFEITSITISPGDHISAQVSYNGSQFTVTLTDVTKNKSFSKTSSVRGAARSSAEWIAEAPCCTRGNQFLPLSDFGTANFGDDYTGISGTNYATEGSTSRTIFNFGPTLCTQTNSSNCVAQINLVSSTGVTEDTTSSLSTDGTSFSVTWVAQ